MLKDLRVSLRVVAKTDASAAKSIASRLGVRKVRHIEVNQLWLQGKVANGEVEILRVAGDKNVADALTKPVDGNKVMKHVSKTGGTFEDGRHYLAPAVAECEEALRQGEAKENEGEAKEDAANEMR